MLLMKRKRKMLFIKKLLSELLLMKMKRKLLFIKKRVLELLYMKRKRKKSHLMMKTTLGFIPRMMIMYQVSFEGGSYGKRSSILKKKH
jgi:hypothetical protein